MGVTTSITQKTAPPTTPLDGGLVATRSAIGSLGTRTQGVVALSLIALPAQAAGTTLAMGTRTARPVTDRLAALASRWTALPNRARSVVGEHPGGLNNTGTDAGSVLNAELAGSAPPQADGIVR
jgi:hypothetical protein